MVASEQIVAPAWGTIILVCLVMGFFVAMGIWIAEMLLQAILGFKFNKAKRLFDACIIQLGNLLGLDKSGNPKEKGKDESVSRQTLVGASGISYGSTTGNTPTS